MEGANMNWNDKNPLNYSIQNILNSVVNLEYLTNYQLHVDVADREVVQTPFFDRSKDLESH
jgi:hypothetical protein